jgi:hypothetical protein
MLMCSPMPTMKLSGAVVGTGSGGVVTCCDRSYTEVLHPMKIY